jgi:hypothetical protein
VVFSRGPLMDVILASGVPLSKQMGIKGVGDLGYELQTALLREQLSMGPSIVLDCGADGRLRGRWEREA